MSNCLNPRLPLHDADCGNTALLDPVQWCDYLEVADHHLHFICEPHATVQYGPDIKNRFHQGKSHLCGVVVVVGIDAP